MLLRIRFLAYKKRITCRRFRIAVIQQLQARRTHQTRGHRTHRTSAAAAAASRKALTDSQLAPPALRVETATMDARSAPIVFRAWSAPAVRATHQQSLAPRHRSG